jgi:hypothetical protein
VRGSAELEKREFNAPRARAEQILSERPARGPRSRWTARRGALGKRKAPLFSRNAPPKKMRQSHACMAQTRFPPGEAYRGAWAIGPNSGFQSMLATCSFAYTACIKSKEFSMETKLLQQIRVLQLCVVVLFGTTTFLFINSFYPLLPRQRFRLIDAERINIREKDGILKAALSNSAEFNEGQRAEQGTRLSGLMFYNEEGEETGGLVYFGKAIPGGQDSDVALTMDQYRQDQNIHLHHEEFKDAHGLRIEDGLSINARPDWTKVKDEYATYTDMAKLSEKQREEVKLRSLQAGKISTRRLFYGVQRGTKGVEPYDDAGIFIKNKWGRNAIKLYVDNDNKPHFQIYDPLGNTIIYELKLPSPDKK